MSKEIAAWIGVNIGVAIILLLEGFGLAQSPAPAVRDRVAAVNGEPISLAELDAAMKQRPTPLNAPTPTQLRQMRMDLLTAMIDDVLMRQFFREHGAQITAAEIDKQFLDLQTGLKAQNKSLNDYLREQNQTEAQVRANLTMLLQLDRYVKEHTTEADMKKYYETYKDFFDKTTVRVSHIVVRVPADAMGAEREKARQRLQALRAEILAGRLDFAKAAQTHSECPSAPNGGDIGIIYRKFQNLDEAFARAAFALKSGEISDVVETEFGVHLIKVAERHEGKATKYEQSIDVVRDCYAEDLRLALLNQLRKKAKIEVMLP